MSTLRPLAVVTGASSGIGYELAKLCVEHGYDLAIAADERAIVEAKQAFETMGATVRAVQTDLSTEEGVQDLLDLIGDDPVDILCANAGHGLGHGFLDQGLGAGAPRDRHQRYRDAVSGSHPSAKACGRASAAGSYSPVRSPD